MSQETTTDLWSELRLPAKPVIAVLVGLGCLLALAEQLPWAVMQTTDWMLAVMALAVAAWFVDDWHPLAGRWCVLVVTSLAVHLLADWLRVPGSLTLLALPVALAAALISLPASAVTAVVESAVLVWMAFQSTTAIELAPLGVAAVAVWAAWGVMVAVYQPVGHLARWSWSNSLRAQRLLDEARHRQGELNQALDDLAHLNRQLALTNQKLDQMRFVAEQANKAKTDFVAKVSHELRTPLNMIVGFGEMILEAPEAYGMRLPPALLADLEVIMRNSQHLSDLIDDVLDLSQVEAGQMALTREHVSLPEVVDAAVTAVRPLFDSKGIYLRCAVAEDLPTVYCDRTRIREVILNLLINAGRFTDEGGVELRVSREGGSVLTSVSDTGPGISPEDSERLFRPFQQLEDPLRRRHGGSGLGLAISKSFVELHGGRMWVESELGQGTTFTFRLPVEPAAPVEAGALRWLEPTWEYRQRSTRPTLPEADVTRRLVVLEEGEALQHLLRRYLDDVEVVAVESHEEALAELARTPAQALIVNDPSVPDALERLAGVELPNGTPVIVASIPERNAVEGLDVSDYLLKPISRHHLLDAVGRLAPDGGTVMIVDDQPDALRLFWRVLASAEQDYRVVTATDGEEALALAREAHPDVILLDLVMPGMDGFQVLAERHRDEALRDIPVVAVSALDPAGHPILSNAVAVTRRDGISVQQFLACVSGLSQLLAMPPQPAAGGPPTASDG